MGIAAALVPTLIIAILLGAPIFVAMGGATLLHFYESGRIGAMIILNQQLFSGVSAFPFLAVPMFFLAAEVMTRGGLTDRLIDLAQACVGHLRGGLAQVNVLSSVFFGGISGSAFADVAAIGAVLIPGMKKEGYPEGFAGAVTAATATLSPMIPPSIVLIVYGATYGVSIGALFAAGFSIAVVLAAVYMLVVYLMVRRMPEIPRHPRMNRRQLWHHLRRASLPLALPIIVVGGIFSGRFTATESAAVASLYAIVLCCLVYRSLGWRELPSIFLRAAMTSSAISILVGISIAFSYIIVQRNVPEQVMAVLLGITDDRIGLAVLILLVLLVAGMFIDRVANVLLFGGILIPIMVGQLGFTPIQTAMIILMALGVGHLTPPVGGTLLTAALVGRMPVVAILRYIWPFIVAKILVTILVILLPFLSEALPRALGLGGL